MLHEEPFRLIDYAAVAPLLFVLRFQPDGSKRVVDESGEVVRTLARGELLQVSKRDRSRLVLSWPPCS